MKWINRIWDVLGFFRENRGNGNTSMLEKIYNTEDVYLIVLNQKERDDLNVKDKSRVIVVNTIQKFRAVSIKKPILVDNHVLTTLLQDSVDGIDYLTQELKEREDALINIDRIISKYQFKRRTMGNINYNIDEFINIKF